MKKLIKNRKTIMAALMIAACFLAACSSIPFSTGRKDERAIREYVQATLDNCYMHDSTLYVRLGIGTAEEAEEYFREGIDAEISTLDKVYDGEGKLVEVSSEDTEKWRALMERILKSVRYKVVSATRIDADNYAVNITYEQAEVFRAALGLYSQRLNEKRTYLLESFSDAKSYNTEVMRIYRTCFEDCLEDISYKPAQSIMLNVYRDKDKVYHIDEETLYSLEYMFIDVDYAAGFDFFMDYPGVCLGRYKGIEVEKSYYIVTDEDVRTTIFEAFIPEAEATDRLTVEQYDICLMDFEARAAGTGEILAAESNYELMIGSVSNLPELHEFIIGRRVGEKFEFEYTYPDDFENSELAGKTLTFEVIVKSIRVIPELTDSFISENTDFDSYEELWDYVSYELEVSADEENEYMFQQDVLAAIIDDAVFDATLDSEAKAYENEIRTRYEQSAIQNDMSLAELVEDLLDLTLDEFNEQLPYSARFQIQAERVLYAVALRENLTASGEDIDDYAEAVYEDAGYDTVEEFMEEYSISDIRKIIMREKALEFVLGNAIAK